MPATTAHDAPRWLFPTLGYTTATLLFWGFFGKDFCYTFVTLDSGNGANSFLFWVFRRWCGSFESSNARYAILSIKKGKPEKWLTHQKMNNLTFIQG